MEEKEILKAMPNIMLEMGAIGKDKRNQKQGWNFRGIDDVYNALQKIMAKNGVFNTVNILSMERKEVKSKGGNTGIHALYKYEYVFHAKDGSYVTTESIGEGIDWGGDKVSNKCASISHKYALLQVFCIPTEDMAEPDKEVHELVTNTYKNSNPAPKINALLHTINPPVKFDMPKQLFDNTKPAVFENVCLLIIALRQWFRLV